MFHNEDRVVSEPGVPERRLWSTLHWAQYYRPHMVIKPRDPAREPREIYYVIDATEAYLTLVDISDFTLGLTANTLRQYVATTGVDEYWVLDYGLGVYFQEREAPVVTVNVNIDPETLPRYIARKYAHVLTNDQLRLLILELNPGASVPKSLSHVALVTRLLDQLGIAGEERETMIALAKGMQKRKKLSKDCKGTRVLILQCGKIL